jgi:hypothetical protein
MPNNGGYWYGFWESNPRRWEACRRAAAAQMVAEGWNQHARKFHDVMLRRARQLWIK